MRPLLRSWPARSLRVLYAPFFYVILRLFLLTHCARFLLRSATTYFFKPRFLRVCFFPSFAALLPNFCAAMFSDLRRGVLWRSLL